ncbi:MAG: DUF2752 domain-containing protein [Clostridia bacterium]|nr:DUF2752 domain-containing protein [Clostridia bacterium]
MADRAKKVIKGALILALIGALYALFVHLFHIGIPCPIKLISGFSCPGCGVTRMCMALLRLDFISAYKANKVLFCLLPLLTVLAARMIYLYIRKGSTKDRFSTYLLWIIIAVLLIWGIVRNI